MPQTISEYLQGQIDTLDKQMLTYKTGLAAAASRTDYVDFEGVQRNLDFISSNLQQCGLYADILAGIKSGYITPDIAVPHK